MLLPNFLIIGAAKSGTTSLYHYLRQHPQIYMSPVKEPNFFAFEGEKLSACGPGDQERLFKYLYQYTVTTIEDYCALFLGVNNEKAIGEGSPRYLYYPKASERIRHNIPEAKLIAILRNPIERAYSHYRMNVQYQLEPLEFEQALRAEEERILKNWAWDWHYVHLGFYYVQLKRYFTLFDRSNVRVYLYDDFSTDPMGVMKDIFQFVGVNDTFVPDISKRYKVSYSPRSKKVERLLTKIDAAELNPPWNFPKGLRTRIASRIRNWNNAPIAMEPRVQRLLMNALREDVLNLEKLIDRDLSRWMEVENNTSNEK